MSLFPSGSPPESDGAVQRGTPPPRAKGRSDLKSFIPARALVALELAFDAYLYAGDLSVPVADFAVGLETLERHAVAVIDLRWLVAKGYFNAIERGEIVLRRDRAIEFSSATSFVMSDEGFEFARRMLPVNRIGPLSTDTPAPTWDGLRRELCLGDQVVKRFRVPATNQLLVLACFEDDGWPVRIEDPLPPAPDIEPKRRLHDTIIALNRGQSSPGIQFRGDGTGCGICWQLG